ncbi:hypothetical protein DPSP01_009446 [Paraphaeosphaeria sporulosa]
MRPDQAETRFHQQSDGFLMRIPLNISATCGTLPYLMDAVIPAVPHLFGPYPVAAKLALHVRRTKSVSSLTKPHSHGKKWSAGESKSSIWGPKQRTERQESRRVEQLQRADKVQYDTGFSSA